MVIIQCWSREAFTAQVAKQNVLASLSVFKADISFSNTVGFRSNRHPFVTVTCLTKCCFRQVTWETVTGSEIRQVSGMRDQQREGCLARSKRVSSTSSLYLVSLCRSNLLTLVCSTVRRPESSPSCLEAELVKPRRATCKY